MTAIDRTLPALSGSAPSAFLSRTVPCSAIRSDSAWCSGVLTFVSLTVTGSGVGWSKSPTRNIAVRMWVTIRSSSAVVTAPDCTAALSRLLK